MQLLLDSGFDITVCKADLDIPPKFFKFLLYHGKGTMHVNKAVFGLIPMLDFSKPWTDEELYSRYKLTKNEIKFIEQLFENTEDA